jgi:FAD dependent oxidoreductase TIGR03364
MSHATAIVIGAGIVGLALARALALRGGRVVVFERHERPVGASLRNAGAVWLLGVDDPRELDQARRSRAVWREFCDDADVWHDPVGCLVPAFDADEWALLQEFAAASRGVRECELLDAAGARQRSAWVAARGLRGALYSGEDMLVDPRVAMRQLPAWLAARHEIEFRWKHAVTRIEHPYVWSGGRRHAADAIYVAGGAEAELLLPGLAAEARPRTQRRLLLRLAAQPDGFRLGAMLCSAAVLARQGSPAALRLRERGTGEAGATPNLRLLQNGSGELVADAGLAVDESDAGQRHALAVLRGLVELPDCRINQGWALPQHHAPGGAVAIEAAPGVTVVAAPGRSGLGMTTAFGLAEDIVAGAPRARAADVPLSARRA